MANAVQLQLRRGSAAQVAAYVGPAGEAVVDTDNSRVVVQDAVTTGGNPAAKLSEVLTNTRAGIANTNYAALATDRFIAFTSLTAARSVTLPAAAAFPKGTPLVIYDESGSCSMTNTVTANVSGSDTLNGGSSTVLNAAYAHVTLISDGVSKWTKIG